MIAIAEFVTILLLVIIILLQNLDIRLRYSDCLSVTLSLTIFAFEINNYSAVRQKRKRHISTSLKIVAFATRLARELLPACTVLSHSIKPFATSNATTPPRIITASILSPILLSYIRSNALAYYEIDDTDHRLDISFSFSLAFLFISLLKASYYTVKSKQRGIRNAR